MSPKDSQQLLKNLSLKRAFSQMLNEIVDEMLNEDVSSLNRQTLKDRLLNKIKEFEEAANQARESALGIKYVESDEGNYFDLKEAFDRGELDEDDFYNIINEETGEEERQLGERGQSMQSAALDEFRLNELKEKLNDIINDMDKIDDLKKTARKAPKKKVIAKEKKEKKETTDTANIDEDLVLKEDDNNEEWEEDNDPFIF